MLLQRAAAFHDQFVVPRPPPETLMRKPKPRPQRPRAHLVDGVQPGKWEHRRWTPAVNAILIMTGSGHRNPFNHVHQQCCQPLLDRFHSPSGR